MKPQYTRRDLIRTASIAGDAGLVSQQHVRAPGDANVLSDDMAVVDQALGAGIAAF
jgi:hypothetical protein